MVKLKGVSKKFNSNDKIKMALCDIDLEFNNKGMIFIGGPSGSGKTTLLNILSTVVSPTNGDIFINNIDFKKFTSKQKEIFRKNNISYIYQEYNLLEDLTILENLLLLLTIQNKNKSKQDIKNILVKLGLENYINSYPSDLSCGEKQRVAIARAVILDSTIILADEPTAALDKDNAENVLDLLKELSKSKLVIVTCHDSNIIKKYADRIILMENGIIVSDEVMNKENNIFDIKTQHMKPRVNRYELFKLGFKYMKLKSFKFWLTSIIVSISLTILILMFSFLSFNVENAYNTAILTESISFSLVQKKEVIDDYSYKTAYFTNEDLKIVDKYFYEYTPIINKKSIVSQNESEIVIDYVLCIEEIDFEYYNWNYIGNLPKSNDEIMINYSIMESLNIADENFDDIIITINNNDYHISGIILSFNTMNDLSLSILETSLILNKDFYEELYKERDVLNLIVSSEKFITINMFLDDIAVDDMKYFINNIAYDSIQRMSIFSESMLQILMYVCLFFLLFMIIILTSQIYSLIYEKKKDIKLIHMFGASTLDIFYIFVIQPLIIIIIIIIGLLIGGGIYNILEILINNYIKLEFGIFIPLLSFNLLKIVCIFLILFLLIYMVTIIPILKVKSKI